MGKLARRYRRENAYMGLVTNISFREVVPHDPDHWVEFRPLSGKQLRKAARNRRLNSAEELRAYGGDLMRAMRDNGVTAEQAAAVADPLNDYDADTMLEAGIIGWSYESPLKGNIENLDEPTERWALETIGRISGLYPESEDEK